MFQHTFLVLSLN